MARYSDDRLNSTRDDPDPNAWRYRDWVIQAFNEDMPYDMFVKAQIAGDLMPPDRRRYDRRPRLLRLSPEIQDDRVDATTRGFLGLTVACAQCHDHKFDPIPTQDYYSLLGIFENTETGTSFRWLPKDVVRYLQGAKKRIEKRKVDCGVLATQAQRNSPRFWRPRPRDICWRRAA